VESPFTKESKEHLRAKPFREGIERAPSLRSLRSREALSRRHRKSTFFTLASLARSLRSRARFARALASLARTFSATFSSSTLFASAISSGVGGGFSSSRLCAMLASTMLRAFWLASWPGTMHRFCLNLTTAASRSLFLRSATPRWYATSISSGFTLSASSRL
jgi:hypothetical protein